MTRPLEQIMRDHIPFDATHDGKRGRVIGRRLDWPLFWPDDGSERQEISWDLASRLLAREWAER